MVTVHCTLLPVILSAFSIFHQFLPAESSSSFKSFGTFILLLEASYIMILFSIDYRDLSHWVIRFRADELVLTSFIRDLCLVFLKI